AGGDFRAYEVLRKLERSKKTVKKVVVIDYSERNDEEDIFYNNNYNSYKKLKNFDFHIVQANIKDPSSCIKKLGQVGVIITKRDKVAIDISCFTKPYFFYFISFFAKIVELDLVNVFYT